MRFSMLLLICNLMVAGDYDDTGADAQPFCCRNDRPALICPLEVSREERRDPASGIFPGGRGRRRFVARGRRLCWVVALGVVLHRRIAVETVHRPGIDYARDAEHGSGARMSGLAFGNSKPRPALHPDRAMQEGHWRRLAIARLGRRTQLACVVRPRSINLSRGDAQFHSNAPVLKYQPERHNPTSPTATGDDRRRPRRLGDAETQVAAFLARYLKGANYAPSIIGATNGCASAPVHHSPRNMRLHMSNSIGEPHRAQGLRSPRVCAR